jgi:hypothetical protein
MEIPGGQAEGMPEFQEWLRLTVQAAVNAVGVAHAQDAELDVAAQFKREMAVHGVEVDDDQWVDDLAAIIHEGRWVVVDRDDEKRSFLAMMRPWSRRGWWHGHGGIR